MKLTAILFCCLLQNDTKVRPYSDPGYRLLGMYRGNWADYSMSLTLSLGDTFSNKRRWWEDLKKAHEAGRLNPHRITCIYFGVGAGRHLEKGLTIEVVKKRLDAWLKSEPGVPTYPRLIPVVCPAEENVRRHGRILSQAARYIRRTYGIPVFQWLSKPSPPSPAIAADGWVWDSYFWEYPAFRKHVMKFVSLGKPANCVFWATDPARPSSRFPDTATMIRSSEDQLRTLMEFNVAASAFAVSGPHGSVGTWRGAGSPDMVRLRNWLAVKRAQMHAFRPGDLPLPSANFSARDRSVPVGGDRSAPSLYVEDFTGFEWIHDANLTGFLDMKLTSEPEERPGFLLARRRPDRPVNATLTYRFKSYFPLADVKVRLHAAAPGSRNELALSLDKRAWPLKTDHSGNEKIEAVTVEADDEFLQGASTFFVRVRMQNDARADSGAANRLDRLEVRCVHKPPPPGAAVRLSKDAYGNLYYDDDFSTARWRRLGEVRVDSRSERGGYRGSHFWIGLGPRVRSTVLVQRVSAPRPLRELTVSVRGYAHSRGLGGHLDLGVAPRGQPVRWKASTDERPRGVHSELSLTVPSGQLESLRDFDVHVVLRSTSGVEGGMKACATLDALRIRAR